MKFYRDIMPLEPIPPSGTNNTNMVAKLTSEVGVTLVPLKVVS